MEFESRVFCVTPAQSPVVSPVLTAADTPTPADLSIPAFDHPRFQPVFRLPTPPPNFALAPPEEAATSSSGEESEGQEDEVAVPERLPDADASTGHSEVSQHSTEHACPCACPSHIDHLNKERVKNLESAKKRVAELWETSHPHPY